MIEAARANGLIFGRSAELARIDEILATAQSASATLALIGEAGIGKSQLLRVTSERAESAGIRVLRAAGMESEAELPFAGLHQLLRPVMAEADRIPSRQADALRTAFGMSDADIPDRGPSASTCTTPFRSSA